MKRAIFVLTILAFKPLSAQVDAVTNCIGLFNQHDYPSSIACLNQVLPTLPYAQQGIPKYYSAESYYNLALAESNPSAALAHLRNAQTRFSECLDHPDLQVSEYRERARYMKGWAQYRLGEMGDGNVVDWFRKAYAAFLDVSRDVGGNNSIPGTYMAGEAKFAQMINEYYQIFSATPQASQINTLLAGFRDASRAFEQVATNSGTPLDLKFAAQIRKADVYFQCAKIYQSMAPSLFGNVNDDRKKGTVEETISSYYGLADYQALLNQLPADKKTALGPVLTYSEAMKVLHMFWLQRDDRLSVGFADRIAQLADDPYGAEKLFRQGNHDQAIQLQNQQGKADDRWLGLVSPNSFYVRSAAAIPESYFWLGMVQSVMGQTEAARTSLNRFLDAGSGSAALRRQVLKEEASYLRHVLRFQEVIRASAAAKQLAALENELGAFRPQTAKIQRFKERLLLKVRVAREVAAGGSEMQVAGRVFNILGSNVGVALEFLQELLPQTASVVAAERAAYLRIIDVLLMITERDFANETRFYRGIAVSLRADIERTVEAKSAKYREAARVLEGVTGAYRGEADYIRARALFFAGDNTAATTVLTDLINNRSSLRALFYLAEIYRFAGQGTPARRCYEEVRNKTCNMNVASARFWCSNAVAGQIDLNHEGSPDVLRGINLTGVNFPDILSRDVANKPVLYEYLADTDFLQGQKADDALALLITFGLPKRTIYPSAHLFKGSLLEREGIFSEFKAPIDESRGEYASSLKLIVVSETDAAASAFKVFFDGTAAAPQSDGSYVLENVPLNTTVNIRVQNAGYYPFISTHLFRRLQADTLWVVPIRDLEFISSSVSNDIAAEVFPARYDQNMILHLGGRKISDGTELFKSFASNPFLRDYVYHPALDAFLAVDAAANRILRIAGDDQSAAGAEQFMIAFASGDSLNSPEGIALDSDGNIYIADWGNHRIIVAQRDGQVIRMIGSLGTNGTAGEAAKFVWPTRIFVAEDRIGIRHQGQKAHRQKLLVVSDRNGVHVVDERGHWLDTLVKPSKRFPLGSFYAAALDGLGDVVRLFVADRQKNEVVVFQQK